MQEGSLQSVEGPNRPERKRKGKVTTCLSWDTELLLLDIGILGSQVFRLIPRLTLSVGLPSLCDHLYIYDLGRKEGRNERRRGRKRVE